MKGYMGKILWVNLSTGEIREEAPDEKTYRDFLGGYGLGAKVIYDNQKAGADPLGPDNILGLVTGPLTGTPAVTGVRYVAVGKSPITGGWGDANSGGYFGPYLKFAGYDAVFFTGVSEKPVYLYISNGKAELKDAGDLWGKDTYETEDALKAEYGKDTHVSCIGPAGEKCSLIACIITKRGAAAGRSGLGAVMGAKRLKAVAVSGNMEVAIADKARMDALRKEQTHSVLNPPPGPMAEMNKLMPKYGTTSMTDANAHSGDTPVKNWGGVGVRDLPDVSGLSKDAATHNRKGAEPCWRCPISCQASLYAGEGEYKYPEGTRRIEYETQGSFGTLCLNTNTESLNMCNHLCNSYGLDTISGGCVIAFAIECYENGIITKEDTDSIELTWGNHRAIVAMTEKMCKREGFGAILADGVRAAAEKIGKGAEKYAVHIGGQELGMHDPKYGQYPGNMASARYHMDATPGRHTQGFGPDAFGGHIANAAGLCLFGSFGPPGGTNFTLENLKAATGWDLTPEELDRTAERIMNIRHAFNLREGINPLEWMIHPRIIGDPPLDAGPLDGVSTDHEHQVYWGLGALDWDRNTAKPSKKKLLELELDKVAEDLWPPQSEPGSGPPM
ncbi:MAG: aldehyde ferredoxin oxidoreductase family protein [Dehalococcoidales bacterium]|nr:aldehyde ferredoxin oxidoreductase family protein [Dehalococcoidales bacterium]